MRGFGASQVALVVKSPTASAGDIRDSGSTLGLVTFLEEGMATHSSILAWRIPWIEVATVCRVTELDLTKATEHMWILL